VRRGRVRKGKREKGEEKKSDLLYDLQCGVGKYFNDLDLLSEKSQILFLSFSFSFL
jgi:hypothetical protein